MKRREYYSLCQHLHSFSIPLPSKPKSAKYAYSSRMSARNIVHLLLGFQLQKL
ncbi:unnamed protein product [Brassica oleracea var. botrytis]